jgi:hypothetical protein
MGTPWVERQSLLRKGWIEPGSTFDDGTSLVGTCIFAKGYGVGTVITFQKSKLGASSHTVQLEDGKETKIALQRKGNDKTPFVILPPESPRPGDEPSASMDDNEDVSDAFSAGEEFPDADDESLEEESIYVEHDGVGQVHGLVMAARASAV